MIIFKAGGSAITDKQVPFTPRKTVMHDIARQLTKINEPTILLHGVGSFGHPPAKEYGIGHGWDGTDRRRLGLMITHYHVDQLSQLFLRILIEHQVPALRLQTAALFTTDKRRINGFNPGPLNHFLEMGSLPMLAGDAPPDQQMGFSVLSADQSTVYLAREYQAHRVIFGMDVPGILDPDGKTIPRLRFAELPDIFTIIQDNHDAQRRITQKTERDSIIGRYRH